ncbi:MAG TPA: RNA methyltransferase [Nitrolancea sp.]|nr:RNA methyltransferase [Nitrolancea sp.]
MDLIASKNNSRIKQIRKLRSRAERDELGVFYVEGIRQVAEAIQLGAEIDALVVAPELLTSEFALDLVERQTAAGTDQLLVTAEVFRSISEREHPHGLSAVIRQRWQRLDEIQLAARSLWVGLDTIADPGNLGTILCTCDAVGADGIILIGKTTDPYDPGAVRASMGAIFSQRLVRTTNERLIDWVRQQSIQVVGTSPDGPLDYQCGHYTGPILLLMGSERHGLPPELLEICDPLVHLPMAGRSDSLNVSVATGVMLYEIFNQRRRRDR